MILGITGTNGAGKGTVVEYLVQKGFKHYSVRDAITEEILRRGLKVNRPNMNEVATDLREKNGPGYFSSIFIADAEKNGYADIVIESIRNTFEAEYLQERGGKMLVVDADRQTRYERIAKRGSTTDAVSFEIFCQQEDREMTSEDPNNPAKMNIRGVMAMADYTLQNDGTLDELHTQIDQMLVKLEES